MAREERTEQPTGKHRENARKKGQVARSADVSGSLTLIAGLFALSLMGPRIADSMTGVFRDVLARIAHPQAVSTAAGLKELMDTALQTIATTVGPVAGVCVITGLAAGAAQVGLRPNPQALKLDFSRINPANGMRNFAGPNVLFEALKAIAKVAVVGVVAGLALLNGLNGLVVLVGISPAALGSLFASRAMGIAEHAALAYLVIAAVDYIQKRRRHEKQLKMTKQQVKDEARQYGVSGEVKTAMRRRQIQAARARAQMLAAVPDASVVVTNPTHYAVALRYDRHSGLANAPEVIAKGKDLLAAQIRRVAEENDVPIVSNPPLARALHSSTQVGQTIPQELWVAVAEVLSFVYRLAERKRMREL